MEIETVMLEDNKEYYIIDTIIIDNLKYLFLSQEFNSDVIVIRKVLENKIIGLDNEAEYNKALKVFTNKYKDIFDN